MANNVTGVLADFGRGALASASKNLQPTLEFRPSGPATKAAGSVIYSSRMLTVTPAISTGAWSIDLEVNDQLSPDTWYQVGITWLDTAGNFVSHDDLPGRLYVPSGGGLFTDLYRGDASALEAWTTPGGYIPPESHTQDLLLDTISGDLFRLS